MDQSKIRVLLLEDNSVEAKIIQRILSLRVEPGYEVTHAPQLAEGLKKLNSAVYDLVLVDLSLPDSEGLNTFLEVQKQVPDLPIIVLTGHDDETLAVETLRRGAQDYLVKAEADAKALLRVMRYAMERKKIEIQLKKAKEALERDEKVLFDMLKSIKKSNDDLKSTQLQLIQAEKLEVVGRLAAGVAHEVKNPLAMLRMGIDYFSKEIPADNTKALFMLKSMVEAVKRADNVIREMLDFSSLQQAQIGPEDLHEVLEKSLQLMKHEIDKRHTNIVRQFDSRSITVPMDKNRIIQVLINLIGNAMDSMQTGGEVTIKTYIQKLEKVGGFVGHRKDDIFLPGDTVAVIEISDAGPGIPEDMLAKIFDPFFTTKRAEGGTGLGLSVVKSIIQLHGGAIMIQNKPDKGAIATIMLKLE